MSQNPRQHLETIVDDLARLAGAQLSPADFYTTLLDRGSAALSAHAAASWSGSANGQLGLDCQLHWQQTSLASDRDRQMAHALLLQAVLRAGEPRLVQPHSAVGLLPAAISQQQAGVTNGQAINPTDHLLALAPWSLEDQSGVLELFLRPGGSSAVEQGYLQFAAALAEIVLEYQRGRQLRALQERDMVWQEFERFIGEIHASTDRQRVCFAIANEGRRLTQCDRATVALQRGNRCEVVAVSGLDMINRRSNAVRKLEQLVAAVTLTGQPLWYHGRQQNDRETQSLAPQIEGPLQAYLEESPAKTLAIVPLVAEVKAADVDHQRDTATAKHITPLGALVIEQFDRVTDGGLLLRRASAVARHAVPALRNALEIDRLPLISINRGLGRIGWLVEAKQLPKTTLALIAAMAGILALVFIPADFTVEGTGELQPVERRDIFAPADGIVDTVRGEHAAIVTKDQPLLALRSPSLDFEQARVAGELRTAEKRLTAVRFARLDLDLIERDKSVNKQSQLTAEEEEIKELIKSLTAQQLILNTQLAELLIRSPLNGQIITWDVVRSLASRPVIRGQKLLTVANTEGKWIVELQVPDDRIGYVLAAQQQAIGDQRPLEVDFVLAAEPGTSYRGTVEKIALRTSPERQPDPSVLVTVRFDRSELKTLRPGATVIGKIDCGRRSLGFVWFHAAWNAIQRRLLF